MRIQLTRNIAYNDVQLKKKVIYIYIYIIISQLLDDKDMQILAATK